MTYADSALDRELALVRSAPRGARNAALHRAAWCIGGLVGAGALDAHTSEEALVAAGVEVGLPEREVRGVVQRSLRRGAECPRDIPGGSRSPIAPRIASPRAVSSQYPPSEELRDLIAHSLPVTRDPEAVDWLESRGLDPAAVELWHLARALAPTGPLPGWARCGGKSWAASGHWFLLPLFDANGRLRSIKARAVCSETTPKELAPAGYSTSGLVFASVLACRLLAGDAPEWWTPAVIVVEGGPDFLTWAMQQRDSIEDGPAVLGIAAGSWTDAIAARIPDNSDVFLRGHESDETGRRYMDKIEETLATRCRVYRRPA